MTATLSGTQTLPDYPTMLDTFIGSRLPAWLTSAKADVLDSLSSALEKHQRQHEDLAQLMAQLQSPLAFTAPLLKRAVFEELGFQLDPLAAQWREVRVFQDRPNFWSSPGFVPNLSSQQIDMPLLQRALQNFTTFQAERGGFFEGTSLLSGGQLLSDEPERFTSLCRKLDLGQQYQAHLDALFSPADEALKRQRHGLLIDEQQSNLAVLTHASFLKKDIDETAYRMLLQVIEGRTDITYAEHEVRLRSIEVLGYPVRGAVAFLARGEPLPNAIRWTEAGLVRQVVLYMPGDPQRPLRQYANWYTCATDMGQSLKSADYQRYFQQLIDLDARQAFLAVLQPLLESGRAELNLTDQAISGELFTSLAQVRVMAIKRDAATIAVPTAQVDAAVAEARRQAYLAIGETVLGVAASFIPGVSQVMLASAVTQLLGEVYEGVADWSRGQREQALAHLNGVAQNLVASAVLGAGAAGVVALAKRSAFIDGLQLVVRGKGQYRLWNQDLNVYRYTRVLPDTLPRRSDGLIEEADGLWLRHEGHSYQVQMRDGSWTLRHPSREQAYAPVLETNGEGAWRFPGEHPLQWSGSPYLVHRLGPLGEGLSDAQIAQLVLIADIDEGQLRGVHVENQALPTRLRDTLVRFGIDARIERFREQLKQQDSSPAFDPQLYRYCQEHLRQPALQEQDQKITAEIVQLREQMPRLRFALFEHLQDQTLTPPSAAVNLLRRDFPGLPQRYAQALIEQADAVQLQALSERLRIPLALAEQARYSLRQAQLSRALEGLWLHNVDNVDSVRLAFGLLWRMPAWPPGLNLELREGSASGRVIERQLSLSETRQTRVLVRREGRFAVYDGEGYEIDELIPEPQGLFEAIACCLSPEQRQALGWKAANSADEIRQTLLGQALSQRAEAARLIGQVEPVGRFNPPQRQRDGRVGYPLSGRRRGTQNPLVSAVRSLYPSFDPQQVNAFLAFVEEDTAPPFVTLGRLLEHFRSLDSNLLMWCEQVTGAARETRRQVADEIRRCWRRQGDRVVDDGGTVIGYRLGLVALPVSRLPTLPVGISFAHVVSLTMTGMGLTDESSSFLQYFFNLRWLNLTSNRLARIPAAVSFMPWLREMNLSRNHINLDVSGNSDAPANQQLATLSQLEVVNLENNPLTTLPNLSGLFHLRRVHLRNTQQSQFPAGLLRLPFLVTADLRGNLISALPEAFFTAPTRSEFMLDHNPLAQATLERLAGPRLAVQVPGEDSVLAETFVQSRALWLELADDIQRQRRGVLWDSVLAEANATDFFRLLTELTQSADFHYARAELDQRVWNMLAAMTEHTRLREELFTLAANPRTCVDSVFSSFSHLEVRFLLFQAVQSEGATAAHAAQLLAFARRLFRLDQVERFARADMQARIAQHRGVDEVEVSLAYRTRLAAQLDLPGQPRNMQFAEIAAVSPAQVQAALLVVRSAEQSDQLATFISGRDFWLAYLRQAHGAQFEQIEQRFADLGTALSEQEHSLSEGHYLIQFNTMAIDRQAALDALALRLTQDALRASSNPSTSRT